MKSKSLILCFLLAAFFHVANAQDDTNYGSRYQRRNQQQQQQPQRAPTIDSPKGYVSVNSGLSSVSGNWGFSVNPQFDGTYAQSGSFQNITAGIPINGSNFGVALMLGFYDNPFDANTFVNNALNAGPTQYNTADISAAGDYQCINLMAGGFYTYPIGRWSLDARAMIGFISCSLPEIAYDGEWQPPSVYVNPTYEDDYDISSSTAKGFAYDLGIGIRYTFRRTLCLSLNADILEANLAFSTVETQQHIDQNGFVTYPPNTTLSGTLPISLFNISLGLGFQFGR